MSKVIKPNSSILSIGELESGKLVIWNDRTVNRLIERADKLEVE